MNTPAEPSDLELAALISSKICHDVISPVGAIYNGLEILGEEALEGGLERPDEQEADGAGPEDTGAQAGPHVPQVQRMIDYMEEALVELEAMVDA